MKPVFAFCGPIGSGKSSVSKLFAKQIGAKWNSFGSTVKEIAMERGIAISREQLQCLGALLIAEERVSFCKRVVASILGSVDDYAVVDGLRHLDILNELRSLTKPKPVFCIFVDASQVTRLERVKTRDGLTAAQLATFDNHSTEIQVERELRQRADFLADNNGTLDDCVLSISNWAKPMALA